MKAAWNRWAARFDALQPRERGLIALAVLILFALIGFKLFVEPAMTRAQKAGREAAEARSQAAEAKTQREAMAAATPDPDAAARAELAALKTALEAQGARLKSMESTLVPPQRMAAVLEEVVGRTGGLRLLALKTLPAEPLLGKTGDEGGKAADKAAEPGTGASAGVLFRHGVEITLEGRYAELTAALERLERAPVKFLWSEASLSAERHPQLVLTLTVYTLSLDRTWLIV